MATVDIPDNKELKEQNQSVLVVARSFLVPKEDGKPFEIQNESQNITASQILLQIMARKKEIVAFYLKPKKLADEIHSFICGLEKEELEPFRKGELYFKSIIGDWQLKEDRRVEEENARLRKEAQERADAQRKELERQQEDERLRMAQELEARGDSKSADEVLAAPIHVAPVMPNVTPILQAQKVKGVSARKKLSFRIIDESLIPEAYKSVDPSKIKKEIAYRGDETSIPGVEIFEEMSISGRVG